MKFLIDNQRALDVEIIYRLDEDYDLVQVLPFQGAHLILEEWKALDVGRRSYRYAGDSDDTEPCAIIIAWATAEGSLVMTDVAPFFDGTDAINGYSLDHLVGVLPEGMIQWGDDL